uniref:MFS domain-containing protein n=1 Tax=Steinernema glaseri TaxID=37863 RepID=A0A1I8AR58_9BILA
MEKNRRKGTFFGHNSSSSPRKRFHFRRLGKRAPKITKSCLNRIMPLHGWTLTSLKQLLLCVVKNHPLWNSERAQLPLVPARSLFSVLRNTLGNPVLPPQVDSSLRVNFGLPTRFASAEFREMETDERRAERIFRTATSASVVTKASTASDPDLQSIEESQDCCFLSKKRWQIAICASFGLMIAFGIRCNFGAAKARMVNNFTDPFGDVYAQEFFWTPTELGMLESSFFYGYAVSQIPGGLLAAKFAPNKLYAVSVSVAGLLNILMAVALNFHPQADLVVVVIQICQGLSLGVAFPAMHGVWRHWAPPLERSKLATTTISGSYLGVMVGMPLSAYLVSYVNWHAPFYAYGVLGILWAVWWLRISAPSPAAHHHISDEERKYIMQQVGPVTTGETTLTTIPWRKILTSLPVWAIVFASFCRSWSFFMLLGNQLTYMQDVLKMKTHDSGLVSALPQLLLALTIIASGQIADYLRSSGKMSTTTVRKMFNSIGFLGEALFLCGLAFITEPYIAVSLLVLASGTSGCEMAGFNVNHFDIAPRYAPILMGFSNGFGALAGIGGFLTEHLTKDNPEGWQACFLVAMCVDLFGFAFFAIFASGEEQEWAREQEPQQSLDDIVHRFSSAVRRMSSGLHRPSLRKKHSRADGGIEDCRSVVSVAEQEYEEAQIDERERRVANV